MATDDVLVIASAEVLEYCKGLIRALPIGVNVLSVQDILLGPTSGASPIPAAPRTFNPDESEFDLVTRKSPESLNQLLSSPDSLKGIGLLIVEGQLDDHTDFPWGLEVLRLARYGGVAGFQGHMAVVSFEPRRTLRCQTVQPRGRHVGAHNLLCDKEVECFRLPHDDVLLQRFVSARRDACPPELKDFATLAQWESGVARLSACLSWNILFIDDEVIDNPDHSSLQEVTGSAGVQESWFKKKSRMYEILKALGPVFLAPPFEGPRFWLAGEAFAHALVSNDPRARDKVEKGLDAVFIDVMFNGVSFDTRLLATLAEIAPRLPVFVLSAATEPDTGAHGTKRNEFFYPVRAIELGAWGYFAKKGLDKEPAARELLLGVVRALSGRDWRREYYERFADRLDAIVDHTASLALDRRRTECQYILFKLFEGADRIVLLRKPGEGLADTRKFFVRAEKRSGAPDACRFGNGSSSRGRRRRAFDRQSVKLVKIGHRFEMREEKRNHDEIVEGYVDTFVARIRDVRPEADDLAGLSYTSVGRSEDYDAEANPVYPITLREKLGRLTEEATPNADEAVEQARDLVRRLHLTVLAQVYKHPRRHVPRVDEATETLAYQYLQVLPSLLCYEMSSSAAGGSPLVGDVDEIEADKIKLFVPIEAYPFWGRVEVARPKKRGTAQREFDELLRDPRLDRHKRVRVFVEGPSDTLESRTESRVKEALSGVVHCGHAEQTNAWCNDSTPTSEELRLRVSAGAVDPVTFILQHLRRPQTISWLRSTVHGDLNLGNVLISTRESAVDLWLTDFAKTRQHAPTGFDLAKLEVEIRTQILSTRLHGIWRDHQRVSGGAAWESVLGILRDFAALERALLDESASVHDLRRTDIRVLYETINEIRRVGFGQLELSLEEYLFGVLCYSIRACTFKNLLQRRKSPSAPLPVLLAYVLAAVTASRLEGAGFVPK